MCEPLPSRFSVALTPLLYSKQRGDHCYKLTTQYGYKPQESESIQKKEDIGPQLTYCMFATSEQCQFKVGKKEAKLFFNFEIYVILKENVKSCK